LNFDFSVEINLINGVFKWEKIEKRLIEMIKSPEKIFLPKGLTDSK